MPTRMALWRAGESLQRFTMIDAGVLRAALLRSNKLPDFPAGHASTGTEDDDDEPEDEHDGENEASQDEKRDTEELPEELRRDDEDGPVQRP